MQLALPYMYRAVDTGLSTLDVRSLTEAARSLGAGWVRIIGRLIQCAGRGDVGGVSQLCHRHWRIHHGRARLWPYMQLLGANRAYEPAALAVIAFAATWGCMGLMQLISRLLGVRKTAK